MFKYIYIYIFFLFYVSGHTETPFSSSIPFEHINGLIVVKASVNGVTGDFILDTGANALILDGIPLKKETNCISVNQDQKVEERLIEDFEFGFIKKSEISALVLNLNELKKFIKKDLSGIIGTNLFSDLALQIDFVNNKIVFSNSFSDANSDLAREWIPLKMVQNVPTIEILINGKKHLFGLDTGATISIIDKKLIQPNYDEIEFKQDATFLVTASEKKSETQKLVFKTFTMASLKLENFEFLATNLDAINENCEQKIAGVISLHTLELENFFIDFSNNKIAFNQ